MAIRHAASVTAITVLASLIVTAPALATGYNATAGGVSANQPITGLPASSSVTLAIANLPAGVGLYGLHCLLPTDPQSAPTRCDVGDGALVYIVSSDVERTSITQAMTVNREFTGANPNPRAGDSGTSPVNCATDSCGIYVLGAGTASTQPQWIRFFPTSFAAAPVIRAIDDATVRFNGTVLVPTQRPVVSNSRSTNFTVTMASGIRATLSSGRCEVRRSKIRALATSGVCVVRITTTGNDAYLPFSGSVRFRLMK